MLVPQMPLEWARLRGPVGTVCVTGDDRIGKSTLLTLWGRSVTTFENFSFSAGHNRSSHTQGLWSAVLPMEMTGLDYHLNMCDSQGLKQVAELEQWRLFSANVLIPSVLVYMLIDVVQNDQLRDLARMAHQFQQLSLDEFGRFSTALAPHLVIVVREESELDSERGIDRRNLTAHLEDALSNRGFEEDKALIRQVFRSREAWSLDEMPVEARREHRKTGSTALLGGEDWRSSGEAVLGQVLTALGKRRTEFPQTGLDLIEWYRSVLDTANSQEHNSVGRLIGYSEQLSVLRRRQRLLKECRHPAITALAGAALLLSFGGFVGRVVDRVAWCAWVLICVCYVGTSPLLTTPLRGLVPMYCDRFVGMGGSIIGLFCREASSQTVAIMLSIVLGALSYPLFTRQFRKTLECLPLPGVIQRSGAVTVLAVAFFGASAWRDGDVEDDVEDGLLSPSAACSVIFVSASWSFIDLALDVRHNRACVSASETGRSLHYYIAERLPEVRELTSSSAWRDHYRSHEQEDAIWRYRRHQSVPLWFHIANFSQACVLLCWALLIHLRCDTVLLIGALANSAHIVWRLCIVCLGCVRRGEDSVSAWASGLEDRSPGDASQSDFGIGSEIDDRDGDVLSESEEEKANRLQIERVRNH